MSLQDCNLAYEYRSDLSNIIDEFYIPCLRESKYYWRAVGYFTSHGLMLAAKGLATFLNKNGYMRLIASPVLDDEDIKAFIKGYEARTDILERALLRQLVIPQFEEHNTLIRDRLSCIAWLIAEDRLDIKLAIPNRNLISKGMAIYHEKLGLFIDEEDNTVAFTGSSNETVGGLINNFESIDVFTSWEDNQGRTSKKKDNFQKLWDNATPTLEILDFPIAVRERVLRFRTMHKPVCDSEAEFKRISSIERPKKLLAEGNMLKVLLENHLKEIKRENHPKGCLLVYKGFPVDFICQVGNEFGFLNDPKDVFSDNRIDLKSLDSSVKESIKKLMNVNQGICVATFEELIAISEQIRLSFFDTDITIITNNLFDQFPNQTNTRFPNIDQVVEKDDIDYEEDNLMNKYYVYSESKFGLTLLQFRKIDFSGYSNIVEKNFFGLVSIENNDVIHRTIDADSIPSNALAASDDDERYFLAKYSLFKIRHKPEEKLTVVCDQVTLNTNRKLRAELELLRQIFTLNGYAFDIAVISGAPSTTFRPEFKQILKEYWHSDSFRKLTFYRNPGLDKEKYEVEQAALIEEIIKESEHAQNHEFFSDVFITSPTGSGKSVLFQIPAIYLHKKFQLVTIIVSPLKALMYDQVTALKNRGIRFAAYIDSDITLVERENIVKGIKDGQISILYLSPELLLSYDVRQFIGSRRLGLLVVDEAHLVTTWGRDFRIDYWYLGTYLKRLRKYMKDKTNPSTSMEFPIVALTATAVYSGPDDIVFETLESLNMQAPKVRIGNVRREEVSFDIRPFTVKKTHEDEKIAKTTEVVKSNIDNKLKTIVYCPWVRQVKQLWEALPGKYKNEVGRFYGDIEGTDKQITIDRFHTGQLSVVLATKAFGMGVDIDDILQIYHHAPSGSLSDYIQEVGRVARRANLKGTAATDFSIKDLKFTKILYGLSSIKQYQVKYALQKINELYQKSTKRQMLVSIEDFGFIFSNSSSSPAELERKVKSALLCLEKDLFRKMNNQYNVMIVRPKALFSTVFACVEDPVKKRFLAKYGDCCKMVQPISENKRRREGRTEEVICDAGDIYELQLDKIWQRYFENYSFPQAKYHFFNQTLFEEFEVQQPHPRYRLEVLLKDVPEETYLKIEHCFSTLDNVFNQFGTKSFTNEELKTSLSKRFKNEALARRVSNLITNVYSSALSDLETQQNGYQRLPTGTFLFKKINRESNQETYRVISNKYIAEKIYTLRNFRAMFEEKQRNFIKYVNPGAKDGEIGIKIAYVVESLMLGNYTLAGGKLSQIFIRVNDPYKLRDFAENATYTNSILNDVEQRHKRSMDQMSLFFHPPRPMSDQVRWNYIEDYFLGCLPE